MTKKIAEITLKISVVIQEDGDDVVIAVERKGTDREVMNLAEIAQNTEVLGEVGVEHVLLCVLNEKDKSIKTNPNGPVH